MHGEIKILLALGAACGTLAVMGCSPTSTHHSTGEHLTISGTPEGWDAYSRNITSLMKTPKEKGSDTSQFLAQDLQREKEKTIRETSPSWLQTLISGGSPNGK